MESQNPPPPPELPSTWQAPGRFKIAGWDPGDCQFSLHVSWAAKWVPRNLECNRRDDASEPVMDGWSLESAWAARRMQCGLQSGCRVMMRVVPEWSRGHTILRRMPPQRMGKHRDGRDGCAGDGPIGRGGETARPRACLIGLFPSFFFGVSSRQPRFISVPSVSSPCWCGWVGFFSIFWIWREEGSSVVGSASFETGNHHPA